MIPDYDQIYNFIGQKYGVTDNTDVVVLDIEGTVSTKTKLGLIKK